MKKLTVLFALLVFASWSMFAQTVQIRGKVTSSEDGLPLPGVSVTVKGTTIGVSTQTDGTFTIQAPSNATALEFRFIGMMQVEVPIQGRTTIDVTMEPDRLAMDEVIVTAIGIKRQEREIGYAVSKVETRELTQAKVTNIATGLSGKVAGLQINTTSNGIDPQTRIVLRGNRSFTGSNQALLVLDGVPVALGYLTSLNPNDIESVNVLKGANAAALYGSEAANGVLIVTTKSGSRDRTTITYSNTTTLEKVAFFPPLQERFGSGSGGDVYGNQLYDPGENQCWGPEFDGSMVQIGRPDENGDVQMVEYSPRPREKYDFWDTGITMQNDLSYSSGSNNGTFYLSLQDAQVRGVVPGDQMRRNVIRVSGSRTYGGFEAKYNFNYTVRNYDQTTSGMYWLVMNTPMQVPLTKYKDWRNDKWSNPNYYYNDYYRNPYNDIDIFRSEERSDYVVGTIDLSQKITSWLSVSARTSVAPNFSYYETRRYYQPYNDWAKFQAANGRSISNADILSTMSTGEGFGFRFTNDILLTFNKKFSDFTTTFIVGGTTREGYSKSVDVSVTSLEIPDFFNVKNKVGELGGSSSWSRYRRMAVFGDLTVGYKNFLFLHGSGRNDWDSYLSPENWSFFYPGVDFSLVFTEAIPALKGNPIINYGKIRGGISKVGSVNIGNYALQNIFSPYGSGFPFGSLVAYTLGNTIRNRNIMPEFTLSKELGLEINTLNNRLNGEFSVYQTNTTNQTLNVSVPNSTGYTGSTINTGEMLNRGFEAEIKTVPVAGTNLRWDVNVNYAYWYNEVVSIAGDQDELSLGNAVFAIVGQSYPVNKVSDFLRDPQGRVIVDAVTGMPANDPILKIKGQTVPKHQLGIQTYLRWKGLTAGANIEYRGGHIFRSDMYYDLLFTGIGKLSAANGRERFVFPNSVIKVDDGAGNITYVENTNITTQDGNVNFWTQTMRNLSNYSVNSAAFWKIRELSINYEVPASALALTNDLVKSFRIGFVGRNLFMFLPKNNLYADPEFNSGTGNAVGLNTSGQTPATRIYGLNVTVTF